ncbi:Type II secretory pathway, component ExeA (predicted ATPase) [Humidesulfovibrio mexicanus]|uniref:Type II secretory pathway, component ExeA (Predicted ATPase) n=1 Tax=Humidesulfovibrio mexicanus TaxID=147047 RepID=A0A239BDK7_9BACT|nr:AAA family ATPase [Humidesulfovibrio mexicanus]SNS06095.1 Type II secretory pathway, component ExeA (predicted ATPase) [Humidesulfovibrio mexicanus]
MLNLKTIIDGLEGVSQRMVADACGLSPAGFSELVNRGAWPKRKGMGEVRGLIVDFLLAQGVPREKLEDAFVRMGVRKRETNYCHQAVSAAAAPKEEETTMLLRRQGLFPETKRHFRLTRNPFINDVQDPADVFMSQDIRYVREAMYATARHGGLMAVAGESGSGKTILRRDLLERLQGEGRPVLVIEPYVLGMEDTERLGKTLRSTHIAEAILRTVVPLETVAASPEARFRQVHRALSASKRAGNSHVLIIEEAHDLSTPLLKHLKRYIELTDGLASLLGILLIGQTELKTKLSESNYQVREVVQRCELVELPPLRNDDLHAYLRFKFSRAGVDDLAKIISDDGIEALRARLTVQHPSQRSRDGVSLCYPLAVGNFIVAALNTAAELGVPIVNADVIRSV